MIFRPIRGELQEALKDSKEITTWNELLKEIDASYYEHPLQVTYENQGWDSRINANSYIICAKAKGYDYPQAAGYTHDDPSKLIGYKSINNDK